jgi:hypothetical protein
MKRCAVAGAAVLALGCTCAAAPRTEIPELQVPRLTPTIDGRLGEWSGGRTERFVDTMTGAEGDPPTVAHLAWDDDALYAAFEVDDPWLRCGFEGHDAHLWEEDAVELMIDPDGDGLRYAELQVSPTNLAFDTFFDARRVPQPFGHLDWSSGLRSAVVPRGTPNDEGGDDGYTVELEIPWPAFAALGARRPQPGETWRIALYVLDARAEGQWGAGWSPPLEGDFHVPARFGRATFE